MNLLVDIGNTRLKWGMSANAGIVPGSSLMNKDISRQCMVDTWKHCSRPQRIAISCVSAESTVELVSSVVHDLWPDARIVRAHSRAQAFGVTNAYPIPEKLGVDRWLSLVAVRHDYPSPACIVDCGTAITLDLIDEKGRHEGGMICPGLTLMKKSLAEGTEALPFNEINFSLGPANCTEAAIHSGVLTAAVGMIEHAFCELKGGHLLILTGGDAELVAGHLVYNSIVDPNLVLRGLAIVLAGSV